MNESYTHSKSLITPWVSKAFGTLPGSPAFLGISLAAVLLIVFIVGRMFSDADSPSGDFRLAVIHILLTAYAVSTYAYLLMATNKATRELAPIIEDTQLRQSILDLAGKHLWWGLLLAGLAVVSIDVLATEVTTIGSDPWAWRENNYDSFWMRVLGPLMCWWIGCLLYILVVGSLRLSKLSDSITSLDLLNLLPYKPLIRQGLTNVLLVVGMSSILSLFLFEPGFAWMIQILTLFVVFAWVGLMLPLRGIREKIRLAKEIELNWCQEALKKARGQLKTNTQGQQSISEIMAYKHVIESVRNWPFDNPTLVRFALYLLIPIASMFGSVFVERGLDLFLL